MAKAIEMEMEHHQEQHDQEFQNAERLATVVFSIGMAGVLATILLMIVLGDW